MEASEHGTTAGAHALLSGGVLYEVTSLAIFFAFRLVLKPTGQNGSLSHGEARSGGDGLHLLFNFVPSRERRVQWTFYDSFFFSY